MKFHGLGVKYAPCTRKGVPDLYFSLGNIDDSMPGGESVLWALKTPKFSKFGDFKGNLPNFHEIS